MGRFKFEIDPKKVKEESTIACIKSSFGVRVVCNYDYDEILGTGTREVLFRSRKKDDVSWGNAMNIANALHWRYRIPLVISYQPEENMSQENPKSAKRKEKKGLS